MNNGKNNTVQPIAKAYVLRKVGEILQEKTRDGWPYYCTEQAIAEGLIDRDNLDPTAFGEEVGRELSEMIRYTVTTAGEIEREEATWRDRVPADRRFAGPCILVHRQYLAQIEEERLANRSKLERIQQVVGEDASKTTSPGAHGVRCVIVESPFRNKDGQRDGNERYAHECIADCIARGEAPFASHLLYTTALDDNDHEQRKTGIRLGLELGKRMDLTAVYTDLGITDGMREGIAAA